MQHIVIYFSFLLGPLLAVAQKPNPSPQYVRLVNAGFEFLEKKECQPCLERYEEAFKISQHSALSRLRAALCAYMCNRQEAFQQHLQAALDKDFDQAGGILEGSYPEFVPYQGTDFYRLAFEQIREKEKAANYDAALRAELKQIWYDDQHLRGQTKNAGDPQEEAALWKKINALDSLNLIKVEKIFAQHGYPAKSKVGSRYSSVAFFVLQHSNLATMKKHYALIEKAYKAEDISSGDFALFYDRFKMWSGEKQRYGTQVTDQNQDGKWEFYPMEDEANVNKRRMEMGLPPLEEYAKHFNIEYKPPVQKNR